MGRIIVFGAGGRAGRAAVREARERGHEVTGVVRDPAKYPDLAVVTGDVTDPESVAALAAGNDAAIAAGYDPGAPPDTFFTGTSRALIDGLRRAGVRRLLVVGLASVLPTRSGEPLMDMPGYPQEYRAFYLGHEAGMAVLRADDSTLDWLVLSPAGDFDHAGGRTGRYRPAPAEATSRISYADLAVALIDQIEKPDLHRTHVGVEST